MFHEEIDEYITRTYVCKCGDRQADSVWRVGEWKDRHRACYAEEIAVQEKADKEAALVLAADLRRVTTPERPGAVTVVCIEACPFDHPVVKGVSFSKDEDLNNFVGCDDCGARGPIVFIYDPGYDERNVREKWNARRKV